MLFLLLVAWLLPACKSTSTLAPAEEGVGQQVAAETLVDLDFTNVLNLDGGMAAWEQADLPLKK